MILECFKAHQKKLLIQNNINSIKKHAKKTVNGFIFP